MVEESQFKSASVAAAALLSLTICNLCRERSRSALFWWFTVWARVQRQLAGMQMKMASLALMQRVFDSHGIRSLMAMLHHWYCVACASTAMVPDAALRVGSECGAVRRPAT